MIIAMALEVAMLVVMLRSADHSTRLVGALLWCGYLRYSATRAAVETFAEWLNDRSNPPGGPA